MRGLVLLLFFVACRGGNPNDGAALFVRNCASCHGEKGQPSAMLIEKLRVRDLTSSAFVARATVELVVEQMANGSGDGRMPSFEAKLTKAQQLAVAAYVISLGAPASAQ